MPIPQPIADAQNAVQADQDALDAAKADDAAADAVLAQAQANKGNTAAAVNAALDHRVTDLDKLITLEQQYYSN